MLAAVLMVFGCTNISTFGHADPEQQHYASNTAAKIIRDVVSDGQPTMLPVAPVVAVLPAVIPVELPPQPRDYWPARNDIDCATLKCVALTFDDGPSQATPRLLDVLRQYDAKATFFVVGSRVGSYVDVAQRIIAEGHEIGNHSFSHRNLAQLTRPEVDAEIAQTQEVVRAATNYTPHIVRPPYGSQPTIQTSVQNYPTILWTADSADWKHHNSHAVLLNSEAQITPGSIVLMHDLYPTTVDAIPPLIDQLKTQGYTFVTITELFGWQQGQPLPNGHIFRAKN